MKPCRALSCILVILCACALVSCDWNGDPTTTSTSTTTTSTTSTTTTTTTLPPKYTVDFDTQDGTAVNSTVTDLVSEFPISSKPGYALEGWFMDMTFAADKKVVFPYSPESDIVLSAKWIPVTDGLNYDLIDGGYSVSKGTANTAGSVVIPEYWLGTRVVDIGSYAFQACTGLQSITLPSGISYIATDAFRHCTALGTVYLNPEVPPSLGVLAFEECFFLSVIKVPGASVAAYKASDGWKEYASLIISM